MRSSLIARWLSWVAACRNRLGTYQAAKLQCWGFFEVRRTCEMLVQMLSEKAND